MTYLELAREFLPVYLTSMTSTEAASSQLSYCRDPSGVICAKASVKTSALRMGRRGRKCKTVECGEDSGARNGGQCSMDGHNLESAGRRVSATKAPWRELLPSSSPSIYRNASSLSVLWSQ